MKFLLLILSIFLLTYTPAQARLAETEDLAKQRYGKSLNEVNLQNHEKRSYYRTSQYSISILFKDGVAKEINYQLNNEGSISISRLEHLLHNSNVPPYPGGLKKSVWFIDSRVVREGEVNFIDKRQRIAATYFLTDNNLSIRIIR